MIGPVRAVHGRIQKAIGPPRAAGQTVTISATLMGTATRDAHIPNIANAAFRRNEAAFFRAIS
jgi:hypothetical protein